MELKTLLARLLQKTILSSTIWVKWTCNHDCWPVFLCVQQMSLDATRWAWRQDLPPTSKLVLLSLADRADESHYCYPSTQRLVKDTGLYRETIFAAISTMEAIGILRVERRLGSANRYQLVGVEGRENQSEKTDYSDTKSSLEKPTSRKKPTSREKPTTQSVKADYYQSGKADSESTNESINNLSVEKKEKKKKISLSEFLKNGGSIDPDENATFKFAKKIGLPEDFLYLSWVWFKRQYENSDKKYIDWLKTWDNAVRGGWGRLWIFGDNGYYLTTAGKQLKKELEHEAVE